MGKIGWGVRGQGGGGVRDTEIMDRRREKRVIFPESKRHI